MNPNHRRGSGSPRSAHPPLFIRNGSPVGGRSHSRQSSLTAMDELASHPQHAQLPEGVSYPEDWTSVKVGILVQDQELIITDGDTPVEVACQLLIDQNLLALPVRVDGKINRMLDFSDLNAFLLLVLGHFHHQEEQESTSSSFTDLVQRARRGNAIPVNLVSDIGMKDPFIQLSKDATLAEAANILGSGVHRIAITQEGNAEENEVYGILSQQMLVQFCWENMRFFPRLEHLYSKTIADLGIGRTNVISINGDQQVIQAFELMNVRAISSIAVVDGQNHLIGNISLSDVQFVTRSSAAPLLRKSCAHFLSIIKLEQGARDGQDQVPVFAVYPESTLGHTIAKLVATRAHRMWVVVDSHRSISASVTCPASPNPSSSAASSNLIPSPTSATAMGSFPSSSSSTGPMTSATVQLPRLRGVVSMTDVLNLLARESGVSVQMPDDARSRRRRASSSSTNTSEIFRR